MQKIQILTILKALAVFMKSGSMPLIVYGCQQRPSIHAMYWGSLVPKNLRRYRRGKMSFFSLSLSLSLKLLIFAIFCWFWLGMDKDCNSSLLHSLWQCHIVYNGELLCSAKGSLILSKILLFSNQNFKMVHQSDRIRVRVKDRVRVRIRDGVTVKLEIGLGEG